MPAKSTEKKAAPVKKDKPKAEKKAAPKKDSKTSVQVSLDKTQEGILDNLRDATSRHDYVQALIDAHLAAANPNGIFLPDDDLPGNERQVKNFHV